MTKNDNWVVTMDLTKMDSGILNYARLLSEIIKPKKIYFLHVMEELKSSSYLPDSFLELGNQLITDKRLTLEHKVDKVFKGSGVVTDCHVQSGAPFEEIIHFVISHNIKLVIAGRKKISGGSGVVSERLSRNLPCDFLLMTENSSPKFNNIVVVTDFSKHSTLAMKKALNFQDEIENVKIIAHHSYGVPEDYSKSGHTYEEFADILKIAAEKEMTRWLIRFKHKITPSLTLKDSRSIAQQMVDTAKKHKADLIFIGSKGQSESSIAMMGSNTMKLIRADETIPIYIAKSKGENLRLLDVLMEE